MPEEEVNAGLADTTKDTRKNKVRQEKVNFMSKVESSHKKALNTKLKDRMLSPKEAAKFYMVS